MTPRYAVVTVTYHPDLEVLRRQCTALTGAAGAVFVDNASGEPAVTALRRLERETPNTALICHDQNLGLAAGLNAGAHEALLRFPDCQYLVFLDQDTEPGEGGVERLVCSADRLCKADPQVGLVGPHMIDAATGVSHGIHVIRGWRWTRVVPRGGESAAIACAAVNGSGSVVPSPVFRALGGFDESLFIDHVDSEWSFRVARAGYGVWTVPDLCFAHRMGARSIRFWLGHWRIWPYRSPQRHYYLFRNAITLMRRGYVPTTWKIWAVLKLLSTAAAHALMDTERRPQLRAMLAGVRAGLQKSGSPGRSSPARDAIGLRSVADIARPAQPHDGSQGDDR